MSNLKTITVLNTLECNLYVQNTYLLLLLIKRRIEKENLQKMPKINKYQDKKNITKSKILGELIFDKGMIIL